MNETNTPREIVALETLLDTYGADPRRWPDTERAPMEALIARSPAAARMAAEAQALDRLLAAGDRGNANSTSLDTLASRIVSAAMAEPRTSQGRAAAASPVAAAKEPLRGVVVPWPGAKSQSSQASVPERRVSSGWRMGALMAASLAAGLLIGALDMTPALVNEIASLGQSDAVRTLAALQGDGLSVLLEEDLL